MMFLKMREEEDDQRNDQRKSLVSGRAGMGNSRHTFLINSPAGLGRHGPETHKVTNH